VSVELQSYRPDLARVTRQECDFGRWEIASRGPRSQLRDYIIGYVGLRSTMRLTRERHLPSGEAALVVNLGTPHDVVGSGARTGTLKFRSVAAMGVHDQPFVTRSAGPSILWSCDSHPRAHACFLMSQWTSFLIDGSIWTRLTLGWRGVSKDGCTNRGDGTISSTSWTR
jgi:hypothetical protein